VSVPPDLVASVWGAHIPRSKPQGIFRQAWINSLEQRFGLLTQFLLFADTSLPKRIT